MSARGWIAIVFLTAVVVLVIAWEAPTTKAGGWPHDPALFIPSLLAVVFLGVLLVVAPKFEQSGQDRNGRDGDKGTRGE